MRFSSRRLVQDCCVPWFVGVGSSEDSWSIGVWLQVLLFVCPPCAAVLSFSLSSFLHRPMYVNCWKLICIHWQLQWSSLSRQGPVVLAFHNVGTNTCPVIFYATSFGVRRCSVELSWSFRRDVRRNDPYRANVSLKAVKEAWNLPFETFGNHD